MVDQFFYQQEVWYPNLLYQDFKQKMDYHYVQKNFEL